MAVVQSNQQLNEALNKNIEDRNENDFSLIYNYIQRLEAFNGYKEQDLKQVCATIRQKNFKTEQTVYRGEDLCTCWYIVQSGCIFLNSHIFLPRQSFGKQIPGSHRRGSECVALEDSVLLLIDYPPNNRLVSPRQANVKVTSQHNRMTSSSKHDSLNSARSASTLDSVTENSSNESSPVHDQSADKKQATVNQSHTNLQANQSMSRSQSSISKTTEDGDELSLDPDDEGDSISLRSEPMMKDVVIEVVKKQLGDRNNDDLNILMEFTRSLEAFKNMTEPTRRSLCKVLVFAWVESAGTVVLKDQELDNKVTDRRNSLTPCILDSWSVIINGQVQVKEGPADGDGPIRILDVGHSFGVSPTMDQQKHSGVMTTVTDDCQFLIVAQQEYFEVLNDGKEKQKQVFNDDGKLVVVKEWRQPQQGNQGANILIRATPEQLMLHLLEDQSQDETYAEDYLLTYRAFDNSAEKIFMKLLESLDNQQRRGKVVRLVLLWVNNHFSDFENDWKLMALLEKFDEKLKNSHQPSTGEVKLLKIACNAKAKKRCVHIRRGSNEDELGFELWGGAAYSCPVYISTVHTGSNAEKLGVKRGDQVIEVNGQNVEKLVLDKAHALIKKNTELRLLLKTSLFCFKEMIENSGPARKDKSSMRHSGPFSSTGRGLKSKHRAPSMTTLNDNVFIDKVSNKVPTVGALARTKKSQKVYAKAQRAAEHDPLHQRSRPPRHRRLHLVIGSHHPRAQVRHPRPDQAPRQPRQHIVVQPQPGRQQQPGRGGRPRRRSRGCDQSVQERPVEPLHLHQQEHDGGRSGGAGVQGVRHTARGSRLLAVQGVRARRPVHQAVQAARHVGQPGRFTPWRQVLLEKSVV